MPRVVLLRHGESEWNRENRFTGWVDVDLSERGVTEAIEAGRLLAEAGLAPDVVHVQWLALPQADVHLRFRSPAVFTAHDLLPRRTAGKRDLWQRPWTFALVIALLCVEWTLRRRWGLR
jgi:hypothetical protein